MNGNDYDLPEPPEFDQSLVTPENGRSTMTGEAVMILDPNDLPDEAQRAEEVSQAFGVKDFFWKEIKLAPFAIDREADWERHRSLLGEPLLREIIGFPMAMLADALRVLWFCSHDPSVWLSIPSMYLGEDDVWRRRSAVEKALIVEEMIREWARENITTRAEGPLAVDVFYELYQSSQSTRAVSKPSEHQKEDKLKKLAMPATSAQYVSLVLRACPGIGDETFVRYHLPQERGWSYMHQFLLEQGADMRWPQSEHNPEGRWWQRVLKTFKNLRL